MQVEGKVKAINPNIQVSATFVKSEMVVTTQEQYPQHIMIEFAGDKADLVDPYKVGDAVKVSINLAGREWVNPQGETKYFNSIRGWRIERAEPQQQAPTFEPVAPSDAFEAPQSNTEEFEDMPF